MTLVSRLSEPLQYQVLHLLVVSRIFTISYWVLRIVENILILHQTSSNLPRTSNFFGRPDHNGYRIPQVKQYCSQSESSEESPVATIDKKSESERWS
jgi:hypothetical protein